MLVLFCGGCNLFLQQTSLAALRCRQRSPIGDPFVHRSLGWLSEQPSYCNVLEIAREFPPMADLLQQVPQTYMSRATVRFAC